MAASFTGFPPATRKFLRDLHANNNREWFAEHKSRYESDVVAPAFAFIEAMEPRLDRIAPRFTAIAAKTGGSLMRIYKDTRFAKDKTPYKTNVGIHFTHELAKDVHAPGYYFHIDPKEIFIGVGIWHPGSDALRGIRQLIDTKPDDWIKARDDKAFVKQWTLAGDRLKRAPKGYPVDHPLIDDLCRTDFLAMQKLKATEIGKADLVDRVTRAYAAAEPFMSFLCKGVGVPF